MADIDFRIFDCDNHYYEAKDAFTRHIEPGFRKRTMQWATVEGRERLLVGGRINRFIPNPTWDPVSKPGALDEYFRGRNPKGEDTSVLFGELDRLADHPEYQDRDARLKLMDSQGMEGAIFLPTLGVGMEQALIEDVPALIAAFRAFNRWMEEDWGFAYLERIFAAPYITLVDAENAVSELRWALDHDARFIVMVGGPIVVNGAGHSPADPMYDGFWSLANESGVTVCYHGGDSRYARYLADWGERSETESFRQNPFRSLTSYNAIQDTIANLLAHRLFERYPNLRIASIETGSDWVFHLVEKLTKSWGQTPHAYAEDPRETFKRHVWVSPFYEDELGQLRELLGPDHILMGSDYPHAEGIADPASYIKDLRNFNYPEPDSRLVMRDNGIALSKRRPA
ncbi:MAG TPA: amidohydrolase family protein [Acidimicrobiales bacterium]|nr:amidohydrolase family protein [Acidimicrobiales bacterium]